MKFVAIHPQLSRQDKVFFSEQARIFIQSNIVVLQESSRDWMFEVHCMGIVSFLYRRHVSNTFGALVLGAAFRFFAEAVSWCCWLEKFEVWCFVCSCGCFVCVFVLVCWFFVGCFVCWVCLLFLWFLVLLLGLHTGLRTGPLPVLLWLSTIDSLCEISNRPNYNH